MVTSIIHLPAPGGCCGCPYQCYDCTVKEQYAIDFGSGGLISTSGECPGGCESVHGEKVVIINPDDPCSWTLEEEIDGTIGGEPCFSDWEYLLTLRFGWDGNGNKVWYFQLSVSSPGYFCVYGAEANCDAENFTMEKSTEAYAGACESYSHLPDSVEVFSA
jgi:hypothetical protein